MPQPIPFVHVRIARQTTVHQTKKKRAFSSLQFAVSAHELFAAVLPEYEVILC